jgi:hypothetical protein
VDSPLSVGAIKQVSHKVLEGSQGAGSDFRKQGDYAAASVTKATDNGGPRNPVGQFPNSGRTPGQK